ncbi:hypothetical protein [Spiroplasma eriocheiris]|uniref:Uncharacterized protein n=1 Tax=Spiroplasma eriocheiris TaxID=315358 RepID=A0A0H3XJK7_9MOLU|nr:hypothetical protein [Spiroplasma eriocheiris]AHF57579.1 hypothetical protein SPE_0450 [Spiroplasma eriocheiris CCTCC M 207170]AKM54036.1 hypothetical protein SERIO_v1c04570 [Spiroplasma eriocheiris]
MKKYFKLLINKLKISFGLFVPNIFGTIRPTNSDNDYEQAYIINNAICTPEEINHAAIKVKAEDEQPATSVSYQIVKKHHNLTLTPPKHSPLLVIIGFVFWFFKIKNVQILI